MSGWDSKGRQWRIGAIKKRDGYNCWLCRERFRGGDVITIDHAIPKARGGTNHIHNLRLAHDHCNHARGAIQETPRRATATRLFSLVFCREEVSA